MTINKIRIIEFIFLIAILWAKKYFLLNYSLVMYLSMEFLNSRKEYIEQPFFKFYNTLFMAYQAFVCIERIRTFKFNAPLEFLINSAEHILFALVICFKISQYMRLDFFKMKSPKLRFVFTLFLFNLIGVFNEIWQNILANRAIGVFIPDSVSDLKMNLIGTIIFSLAMFYEFRKI